MDYIYVYICMYLLSQSNLFLICVNYLIGRNQVIQGPRLLPHIDCSKHSISSSESGLEMRRERSPAENFGGKFRGHLQCHRHPIGQ